MESETIIMQEARLTGDSAIGGACGDKKMGENTGDSKENNFVAGSHCRFFIRRVNRCCDELTSGDKLFCFRHKPTSCLDLIGSGGDKSIATTGDTTTASTAATGTGDPHSDRLDSPTSPHLFEVGIPSNVISDDDQSKKLFTARSTSKRDDDTRLTVVSVNLGEAFKDDDGGDRWRVPCPYDAKHSCFLDLLPRHLKICNARPRKLPPHRVIDVNAGSDDDDDGGTGDDRIRLADLNDEQLTDIIVRVDRAFRDHVRTPSRGYESEESFSVESLAKDIPRELYDDDFGQESRRHWAQNGAIVQLIDACGFIEDDACFVEFGAGRGKLSCLLADRVRGVGGRNCTILLVDRASPRHKLDNKFRQQTTTVKPAAKEGDQAAKEKKLSKASEKKKKKNELKLQRQLAKRKAPVDVSTAPLDRDTTASSAVNGAQQSDLAHELQSPSLPSTAETGNGVSTVKGDAASASAAASSEGGVKFVRIREDIVNLRMSGVDGIERQRTVVGFGKHLCGMATDLALRCLTNMPTKDTDDGGPRFHGLAVALCCHHRCEWRSYVGKAFIRRCGFTPDEFSVLCGLTSWAVCGNGGGGTATVKDAIDGQQWKSAEGEKDSETVYVDETNEIDIRTVDCAIDTAAIENSSNSIADTKREHSDCKFESKYDRLGLSAERRQEIGFLAKLIIDQGRVEFLKETVKSAQLKYYVPSSVSPENVILIASC